MKSFEDYIKDAERTLDKLHMIDSTSPDVFKLILPIHPDDVESIERQKLIANIRKRTASLKKSTAKRTAPPIKW
jgi:hypothetical protein